MMLREISGPVGRLEALIDEPADARGVNTQGLVEGGRSPAVRAAVAFGPPHPQHGGTMHTKVVFQSAKGAGPNRVRRASLQLPRGRAQRRLIRQRLGRKMTTMGAQLAGDRVGAGTKRCRMRS